jgi:hypothetical protein
MNECYKVQTRCDRASSSFPFVFVGPTECAIAMGLKLF